MDKTILLDEVIKNNVEGMKLNKEKFKTVLHYIINKTSDIETAGKTVLYKILYFSDFDFYELYERSITGETYERLPQGPGPKHFSKLMKELKDEQRVREVRVDKTHKFLSLKKADISKLSAEEKKCIDNAMSKLGSMTAGQISHYSHGDMPWKSAKEHEDLNYEMVFYRNGMFSVRDNGV